MRVLIVNPAMKIYGGAERVIITLANYLTKKNIDNSLLTTDITQEMRDELKGTTLILQKPEKPSKFDVINSINEVMTLQRGVRKILASYDIINLHNYPAELSVFPSHKKAIWLCNEPPVINWTYNTNVYVHAKIIRKLFLAYDRFVVRNNIKNVVVADKFNAERFEGLYGIKPHIINYGIDFDFFSQQGDEKTDISFADYFVVLHSGLVQPMKNQFESIKTIEKLKQKIPEIKLILAGHYFPNYYEILNRYIKEKRLQEHVSITGHLTRSLLRDYYHSCDVLLHPVKPQGGWLAPFEALCATKPIVTSKEFTAADIVKEQGIGIVTEDYEKAILSIYENRDEYRQMALKGHDWVRDSLSWEKFCQKMVELFYTVSNLPLQETEME